MDDLEGGLTLTYDDLLARYPVHNAGFLKTCMEDIERLFLLLWTPTLGDERDQDRRADKVGIFCWTYSKFSLEDLSIYEVAREVNVSAKDVERVHAAIMARSSELTQLIVGSLYPRVERYKREEKGKSVARQESHSKPDKCVKRKRNSSGDVTSHDMPTLRLDRRKYLKVKNIMNDSESNPMDRQRERFILPRTCVPDAMSTADVSENAHVVSPARQRTQSHGQWKSTLTRSEISRALRLRQKERLKSSTEVKGGYDDVHGAHSASSNNGLAETGGRPPASPANTIDHGCSLEDEKTEPQESSTVLGAGLGAERDRRLIVGDECSELAVAPNNTNHRPEPPGPFKHLLLDPHDGHVSRVPPQPPLCVSHTPSQLLADPFGTKSDAAAHKAAPHPVFHSHRPGDAPSTSPSPNVVSFETIEHRQSTSQMRSGHVPSFIEASPSPTVLHTISRAHPLSDGTRPRSNLGSPHLRPSSAIQSLLRSTHTFSPAREATPHSARPVSANTGPTVPLPANTTLLRDAGCPLTASSSGPSAIHSVHRREGTHIKQSRSESEDGELMYPSSPLLAEAQPSAGPSTCRETTVSSSTLPVFGLSASPQGTGAHHALDALPRSRADDPQFNADSRAHACTPAQLKHAPVTSRDDPRALWHIAPCPNKSVGSSDIRQTSNLLQERPPSVRGPARLPPLRQVVNYDGPSRTSSAHSQSHSPMTQYGSVTGSGFRHTPSGNLASSSLTPQEHNSNIPPPARRLLYSVSAPPPHDSNYHNTSLRIPAQNSSQIALPNQQDRTHTPLPLRTLTPAHLQASHTLLTLLAPSHAPALGFTLRMCLWELETALQWLANAHAMGVPGEMHAVRCEGAVLVAFWPAWELVSWRASGMGVVGEVARDLRGRFEVV